MLKFRMHNCGTIVCFLNDKIGFALIVSRLDNINLIYVGVLDKFNFHNYPEIWIEI